MEWDWGRGSAQRRRAFLPGQVDVEHFLLEEPHATSCRGGSHAQTGLSG